MRWRKKQEQPRRRQLSEQRIANERQQSAAGGALFKRNRTLTGSLSVAVVSANELDANLRSPRAHAHHLAAHRRRLGTILFVVTIVILFLTWLLYEFTAVARVSPSVSSVTLSQERYEKALDGYFAIHPIERLRFLLNETALSEYMRQELSEVATVRTSGAAGPGVGQFELTLRRPIAGWLIGNEQYFVDSDGVAFKTNYFEQPAVAIVDESGIPQTAGSTVASSRFLSFVGRSVAVAHDYGLVIEKAIIPSETTRQVEYRITGHEYPIKLSLDRPVGEQVEDMQRAVTYFDSREVKPKYIDVRVSGKAFYQ